MFASVGFDLLLDQRAILRDDRAERFPVERFLRDRVNVLQISSPQTRHGEHFAAKRLANVIHADERIEIDVLAARRSPVRTARPIGSIALSALFTGSPSFAAWPLGPSLIGPTLARPTTGRPAAETTTARPTTAGTARSTEARSHRWAEGFVHVVRQDVKLALLVQIDAVVAGSNPIAIAVDERVVEREEPQQSVDVEHRLKCGFQFFRRRFVERLAELDERLPGFVAVVFDLVTAFVIFGVVTDVFQATTATRRAADLPARSLRRRIILSEELLVELLHVGVHAPAFTVDDHFHEVRFRCRDVLPSNVRIQNAAQERIVFVGVQQVQRFVAVQPLFRIDGIERHVQRSLRASRDHHVRRHASEVDTDVRIFLAVDRQRRGDFDVGVVEVSEFRFPIFVLEVDEDRAQDLRVVQRRIAGRDVLWRNTRTRFGWL